MATVPEATEQSRLLRYSNAAVTLHWLTAALILVQIWLGFTFADMPKGPARMEVFTWHKSVGVTILLLALIRLAVRLKNPPPPFPEELPRWERLAAVWNHRIFYFLLIIIPLAGLLAVSGGATKSTTGLIGGIPFPLIPGISEGGGEISGEVHEILVFAMIALLALHVGAALKHQFFVPSRAAGRMPPFRAPGDEDPVRRD